MSLKIKYARNTEKLSTASASNASSPSNKEKLGLVSLEPRILLDAAGFVTGAEVAMDAMAFEDAQMGVEGLFDGTAPMTQEASDVDAQRAELMGSLAFAEQDALNDSVTSDENEDPAGAPRTVIYLADGTVAPESEDPTDAPRTVIYLADDAGVPEGEDATGAPRTVIYLADGSVAPESEDPTDAPRTVIYLADGTIVETDDVDAQTLTLDEQLALESEGLSQASGDLLRALAG